ncbi:hypothetical protein PV328_001750 [Microctonus aethiopoides]|uniref:PHR domain-containing protein n=1 Tax=Microctonus aethiopoides TaxID=144406 RepID=A0AA39KXX3_9HYME|nr:hypothetical protein PV328_001750 [Microctonus aethiopoides]
MLSGDYDKLQSEPQSYIKSFYELFKNTAENHRSKNDWKKCKKTRNNKKREKKKLDPPGDLSYTGPPEIELSSNASAFAVFASVRDAILEKNSRYTNETYRISNCNSPQLPELSDTIDTDSDDEDRISSTQNLPKIVGIGLRSVFTLIRESRTIDSQLCTKALGALLDVLQGQLPEGLKSEPEDVIEPLFDLLLDLATSHGPESTVANNGTHLTAVACACLLSLIVVRGDTGRLLAAIAALLMCPRALATQNIQMPCVLASLQRSVEAVLLGKIPRPDWITYGVPKSSKLYTFNLRLPSDMNNILLNGRSFVSDGKYLYLHTNRGLLKIGSGYGGTIGGQLYAHKPDFYPAESGWLGYANSSLYFKCAPKKQCELLELDADTLTVKGIAVLEGRDWPSSVMFSDGDNLGMITAGKDEGFVVRTINTLSNPVTVTSELPLKLARKCVDVFGWASFDEEQACHNLSPGCDDEVISVTAGKEFCILKTATGKLLFTGKGSCLGMKSNTRPNRWLEFTLGKGLRVSQIAVGHDGQHVILVMDDGSVLFAGTARRGEDGDSNKIRRVLKPVKPKKMLKIDGQCIVDAACNNGSTALVTKEGSLLMFGKDTIHSDPTTGHVNDLKDIFVQRVALGKAHAAVMTNKGHLYTFGINNKGQCGRDFTVTRPINKEVTVVAMETGTGEDELIIAEDGRSGSNLKDYLKRRLEERKQRQRIKAGPSAVQWSGIKMKSTNNQRPVAPGVVTRKSAPVSFPGSMDSILAEIMAGGSDAERGDATRIASIPPARVHIPSDSPVIQITCGLHHTVVLLQNGEVYSFGSNIYGQLGVGDLIAHAGPVQVKLPTTAIQIATGSNHTVILTSKGDVYTFGAYQKGQLGMNWWNGQNEPNSLTNRRSERTQPWHSFPNVVPNIGPRWGRRATWIGAAGDQTYIKVDEINSISLTKSTVMANKNCIILIPHQHEHANTFKCLVINKRDGSCNSFSGNEQVDFSQCATCLDSLYNVIWTFRSTTNELCPYNVITTEARTISNLNVSILSPGLALPVVPMCFVTRTQAAMHLLGCLDTLTQAQDERLTVVEENETNQLAHDKVFSREDFVTVNRFENHGGGWGYSGHSIEAIRFMTDTDILLGGYGLFGGRGEYTAKIKLFDIGIDGGDQENDGELMAETEEIPYECEPRQKYSILFEEPVTLQANRWYIAWARVSGPSSDCGSGGQAMVTAEDQVMFYFKSSKKSNNGTDVNAGQIPQLLYRIIPENQSPNCPRDQPEPVYILRREFSRVVTKNCFQSLISLLQWSWNTLKAGLSTDSMQQKLLPSTSYHSVLEMDHLVYISEASLRLLRTYTNEIYPNYTGKKTPQEAVLLAECIGDVRALLRQILSDSIPGTMKFKGKTKSGKVDRVTGNKMIGLILDECHKTFVACYHAFYPTAYLKWTSLCELLSEIDKEQGTSPKDRLLSAVLASLCNSMVRLRCTFPILSNVMDSSDGIKRQLSPSDNAGLPMMNSTEAHQYPILVEQMSYKSQMESIGREVLNWSFRDVLDRLLDLILVPVKRSLCREKNNSLPNLILHCCYLLARVIAELAAQSSGNEDELQAACGRFMYTTPSRFTRTNQTRTWNTGNGSPDAICFSVDRAGIVVAGVAIYGGIGMYNYELELLDDQNNTGNDPSHTQRWSSLDFTRGSFGPDDCVNDIVELKFSKPLSIKENVKYAIRLRNHGGRTSNGDGGLNIVRGPDGTNFTFTACSLSFNGTTQTRGQIPHILYYSNPQDADGPHTSKAVAEMQARKCTLAMTTTIVHRANEILSLAREKSEDIVANEILGNATFITTLLPLVMAHLGPLATSDPRSAVQVLTLIQEMLPHVAGLNLLSTMGMSQISQDSESQSHITSSVTTSHHYTWLESDHPYKPATVSCYKVTFPETVKWMTIEFTGDCGTAQPEDYLQIYIPNIGGTGKSEDSPLYLPVLHKMSNISSQWPQYAVVLPGNELLFSLETASDYMKDDMSVTYGFKCLIIGYDWITAGNGLKNLENELSFLGGGCALSLMKKNLILPAVSMEEVEENVKVAQDTAKRIFAEHSSLLGRGFALAAPPTVTQALDGVLPFRFFNYSSVNFYCSAFQVYLV